MRMTEQAVHVRIKGAVIDYRNAGIGVRTASRPGGSFVAAAYEVHCPGMAYLAYPPVWGGCLDKVVGRCHRRFVSDRIGGRGRVEHDAGGQHMVIAGSMHIVTLGADHGCCSVFSFSGRSDMGKHDPVLCRTGRFVTVSTEVVVAVTPGVGKLAGR